MVYVTKFYVGCGKRVFKAKDREIVENAERGKKKGGFYQDWVHQKARWGEATRPWAHGGSRTTKEKEKGPGQVWVLWGCWRCGAGYLEVRIVSVTKLG